MSIAQQTILAVAQSSNVCEKMLWPNCKCMIGGTDVMLPVVIDDGT